MGKGTQAQKLMSHFGVPQISTGDILRAEVRKATPLGKKSLTFMNRGELLPDDLILDIIAVRLEASDAQGGAIFDGFPRTIPQAEGLDKLLKQMERRLDAVLLIEVPTGQIVERLSARRSCATCGAVFNMLLAPEQIERHTCPKGQAVIVQREDDRPETIQRRLEIYARQTEPLKDYYRNVGLLKEIEGEGTVEEVFDRLIRAVAGEGK